MHFRNCPQYRAREVQSTRIAILIHFESPSQKSRKYLTKSIQHTRHGKHETHKTHIKREVLHKSRLSEIFVVVVV